MAAGSKFSTRGNNREVGGSPHNARNANHVTLGRLLHHVSKLTEDHVRGGLAEVGLQPTQGTVLHLLETHDDISQNELARQMRVSAPTLSGVLKRMEAAGLVKRQDDRRDSRVARVRLTATGRRKSRQARRVIEQVEQTLVDGLSESQLRSAHGVLRKLRDNLGGHGPSDEPPLARLKP